MPAIPRMLHLPEIIVVRGRSRQSHFNDIRAGLFPPGVLIGKKQRGWPDYELEAIQAATIAGFTEDQIKVLVQKLIAKRTAGKVGVK